MVIFVVMATFNIHLRKLIRSLGSSCLFHSSGWGNLYQVSFNNTGLYEEEVSDYCISNANRRFIYSIVTSFENVYV